jgi:hypothetical protein
MLKQQTSLIRLKGALGMPLLVLKGFLMQGLYNFKS